MAKNKKPKNNIKLIMNNEGTVKQSKYNLDLTIDKIKNLINGNNINIQINMLKEIQSEYYFLVNDHLLSFYGTYQKYFDIDFKFKMLRRIKNEIDGMTFEDSYEVKTDELFDFMNKCRELYFVLPDLSDKIDYNKKVKMWNNGKDAIIKELGVFIPFDDMGYMIQFHNFNEKYVSRYNEIIDLLNVKKVYLNYIERNQIWNFEDCTFDFDLSMIIEFSMNLESVKDRLIYLKYIEKSFPLKKIIQNSESDLELDKPTLADEIYKLEVILRINPNTNNPTNKMNIQTVSKSITEQENAEPKQEISKPLNKFTFNNDITEENIVLLFNLLNQTGFISDKDFSNLGKILQDTFLNGKGKQFVNTQINKVKTTALNTKKLTEKKNLNLLKLYRELKKLIPD
jgi:hypothetical protein